MPSVRACSSRAALVTLALVGSVGRAVARAGSRSPRTCCWSPRSRSTARARRAAPLGPRGPGRRCSSRGPRAGDRRGWRSLGGRADASAGRARGAPPGARRRAAARAAARCRAGSARAWRYTLGLPPARRAHGPARSPRACSARGGSPGRSGRCSRRGACASTRRCAGRARSGSSWRSRTAASSARSPLRLSGVGPSRTRCASTGRATRRVRIHWKATARHGRLVTREDTWERGARLVVLLDCGARHGRAGRRPQQARPRPGGGAGAHPGGGEPRRSRHGRAPSPTASSARCGSAAAARSVGAAYGALFDLEARLAEPAYDLAAEHAGGVGVAPCARACSSPPSSTWRRPSCCARPCWACAASTGRCSSTSRTRSSPPWRAGARTPSRGLRAGGGARDPARQPPPRPEAAARRHPRRHRARRPAGLGRARRVPATALGGARGALIARRA